MKNSLQTCDLLHNDPSSSYFDTRDYLLRGNSERPMFLFSKSTLHSTSHLFQAFFPGEVSYAVKANPEKCVLKSLWETGIRSYDVASLNEIILLKSLFSNSTLHYNNPIRSSDMIRQAYIKYGVRSFAIDDYHGMHELAPYIDQDLEITVRFKLPHNKAAYDFGSKFGATVDESIDLLKWARAKGGRCSLTFHPGSQCTDPKMYSRYIQAAAFIADSSNVTLKRLNIGGGFPVNYDGRHLNSLTDYLKIISDQLNSYFARSETEFICEPGRAMVASAISLMSKVIHVRDNGDVFLNDGIYGGLQERLFLSDRLPVKVWRNAQQVPLGGDKRTLFGPTCDPIDKLPEKYQLSQTLKVGDYIEFGRIGAYGSATATRFNGFDLAEYVDVDRGFG